MNGFPIVAHLATYPKRADQLPITLRSLVDQVAWVNVYCNEYEAPPFWARGVDKLRFHFGANLGDAGKFWMVDATVGYNLICDDDIEYPADYAAKLVAAIERYQRRAVVGLHAVWITSPAVTSYYADRRVLNAARALDVDTPCHLLATNSCAFHTSTLRLSMRDFPVPNYADPFFAACCRQQRVPCVAIARPEKWIHHLPVKEALFQKFGHGDDALHTKLIQLLSPWEPPCLPSLKS